MGSILPLLFSLLVSTQSGADIDSVSSYHDLPPIEVTAPLKQRGAIFDQPITGTSFVMGKIESEQINTQKDFSLISPNLYIPDYGSKMTGTIYVRGIGARMEQPSMGLYLDNVPILNKNNYEFDFYDIRRADVLRGPQGTLYGRNSIGGVINIFTLSPHEYQGVRVYAGYGNGNTADLRASVYRRETDKFGWSLAAGHHSSDGFYTNRYDGSHADKILTEGVRNRLQWKLSDKLFVDNTLSFNYVKQKGFAYAFIDPATGKVGEVNHNDPCKYDRTGIINGTTVRYDAAGFQFQSVTSYQYMDDRMTLDQDFLPVSMFTLVQAQKEHAVTQEVIFRSSDDSRRWQWLTGAFGFYRHNRMNAPVTFLEDGVNEIIVANSNKGLQMVFPGEELFVREDSFEISSRFTLPSYGVAAFHQSSYDVGRWRLTAGLRFDYEYVGMTYGNAGSFHYLFTAKGNDYHKLTTEMSGRQTLSYLEFLPRFSAMYRFAGGNLYAMVSKGYKAGGINPQIFSEILRGKLTEDLISEISEGLRPDVKNLAITYDPEYNWNYEAGAHFAFPGSGFHFDAAAFYIDSRNQQLTVFPPGQTTGRMMSNAGKSRSYGVELSGGYTDRMFRLEASYGFTDAEFIEYIDGTKDYKGNKVPYAPRHTLYLGGEYRYDFPRGLLDRISFRVDWRGAGKIYWNEENSVSQDFYGLLGAGITLRAAGNYSLDVWGRNLTGKNYSTFYFVSMENRFAQKGKPRQWGVTLRLNL